MLTKDLLCIVLIGVVGYSGNNPHLLSALFQAYPSGGANVSLTRSCSFNLKVPETAILRTKREENQRA